MKKVLFLAVACLFLASCKKDYTCICKVNGTQYSATTIHDTKKNAEAICNQDDGTISYLGLDVVIECGI